MIDHGDGGKFTDAASSGSHGVLVEHHLRARASGGAQDVRLDIARDTWVSAVGSEADGNNGGASRLKLKSIQEMSLIDVDPAPLRGPGDQVGNLAPQAGR